MMQGVAIKDFRWERNAKGDWVAQKCPLGEGMVNFKRFFAMLKAAKFSGPVQMHFEYPLGGAESGAKTLTVDKATVIAAMRKDLETLRGWLREAQLA
jgi:sugar phosphate isomerase/epimerase